MKDNTWSNSIKGYEYYYNTTWNLEVKIYFWNTIEVKKELPKPINISKDE